MLDPCICCGNEMTEGDLICSSCKKYATLNRKVKLPNDRGRIYECIETSSKYYGSLNSLIFKSYTGNILLKSHRTLERYWVTDNELKDQYIEKGVKI